MAFWYWLSGAWHRSQPYLQEAHCGRLRIFFLSAPPVLRRTRRGEYQEIGAAERGQRRGGEGEKGFLRTRDNAPTYLDPPEARPDIVNVRQLSQGGSTGL